MDHWTDSVESAISAVQQAGDANVPSLALNAAEPSTDCIGPSLKMTQVAT